MLKHLLAAVFVAFAAFVSAEVEEAEGHGCGDCFRGRKGKDGHMGQRGPMGFIGVTGDQGDQGPIGDDTTRVHLGLFRTLGGNITTDENVYFNNISSMSVNGFVVNVNAGTEIIIEGNATYVVTYTVDAEAIGIPVYFQLDLNGVYVPNSRYGVTLGTQQVIGQALVDVPEPGMSLRLRCVAGTAFFNTGVEGQNNASINIIRVGRSGLQ